MSDKYREALENIRDIHAAWYDTDEAIADANGNVEAKYDRCTAAMDAIYEQSEKALDPGRPLFPGPGEGLIRNNKPAPPITTVADDQCGAAVPIDMIEAN